MGTTEQPRYVATAPSGTISWQATRHVFASVIYTRFLTGDFFSERAPPAATFTTSPPGLPILLTFSWGRPFHAGPALSSIYGKIGIVGLGVNRAGWAAGRKCNDPERNGSHREHEPARGFPNQSSNGLS